MEFTPVMLRNIQILIVGAILCSLMFIAAKAFEAGKIRALDYIIRNGVRLDFGIAPQNEVLEKFGDDVGNIILEERRLIFYRLGWVWAIFGAALTIAVILALRTL